jgi:SPP1 family holin
MTKENVVGIFLQIICIINTICELLGKPTIKISDDDVRIYVSIFFFVVTTAYNTYKNRNFTSKAQKIQKVLDLYKNNVISDTEIDCLLNESERK